MLMLMLMLHAAAAAVAAAGEGGGEDLGGQKSLEEDDEVRRVTLGQCVHGAGRLSGQGSSFSRAHIWVTRTILRCHTGRALLVVFTRCPESLTCITDPR